MAQEIHKAAAEIKINPNNAPRDELTKLPGIGEEFANRIIEARPYAKSDDLLRVPGQIEEPAPASRSACQALTADCSAELSL